MSGMEIAVALSIAANIVLALVAYKATKEAELGHYMVARLIKEHFETGSIDKLVKRVSNEQDEELGS